MNNNLETNLMYMCVPEWAKAEKMDRVESECTLWNLSEKAIEKHETDMKIRRAIARGLIHLAQTISYEEKIQVVAQN